MKVLHILNHSFPLLDGYSSRSQNIIKAQKKMGYLPVVLTSSKHEDDLKRTGPAQEIIDGFTFYRSGKSLVKRIPIVSELLLMFILLKRLMQVIAVEKPDILHAHSPVLNVIPSWIAGKVKRLPVVYELRAYWEDAGVDQNTYRKESIKYKFLQALETAVCKRVDQVAVLCEGIQKDMACRGVDIRKMTPVFNGINPENLKPDQPDSSLMDRWNIRGKRTIGFIGSFYRYEGLDLLVKAFGAIARNDPNLILLLVGGGEVEQQLKVQVARLGIEDRVRMPGRIPHNKVGGVYSMMDVMIYPRYSIRLTELVTPLKPLEAMAMGKAIIASDIGGHRELIVHNQTGILFPAGDPVALSRAIEDVLSDPALMNRLGKQGMTYVLENKTWDETTSVYKKIYARLPGIAVDDTRGFFQVKRIDN
jgi:PEP-CTERM/exosortase A-associated glycosyltransferase